MRLSALSSLLLGVLIQVSCGATPTPPLEMTTLHPGGDHETIAYHYHHEAMLARQQAEELAAQAVVYAQLFGLKSDWVSGTTLLVQFYQEIAQEQDRLAEQHLKLVNGRSFHEPADRKLVNLPH